MQQLKGRARRARAEAFAESGTTQGLTLGGLARISFTRLQVVARRLARGAARERPPSARAALTTARARRALTRSRAQRAATMLSETRARAFW